MGTTTEIPPIRVAYAGVRIAIALALVPAALWLAYGWTSLRQYEWCGVNALFGGLALVVASLYTAAWLLPCAAIIAVPAIRQRIPLSSLQRKLLTLCAAGILGPALLTAAAFSVPAGPCQIPQHNKIPVG